MISEPAKPIRVMLVDDHGSVLWGLEKLIDGEKPRMEVVAKAGSRAAAIDLAAKTRPDVILLDLDLAGEDGAELIPELVKDRRTRVLILTGARDPQIQDSAILRGARGLIHKEEPTETILKAIEKVHQGELWLDRITTGRIFVELSRAKDPPADDPEAEKISSLTARERDIVSRIANDPGAENRSIAETLHMSEHTLRNHVSRIYGKLGVPSRLELYVYAQKHGLGKPSR